MTQPRSAAATWARRSALALLGLALAAPASAQVGSPTSYASLGTLNPAAGTYTLDTTAQTLTIGSTVYRGVVQAQPNGPNVIVFAFANVTIGNGVTINATGSQPFALLSQSNVTFNGTGTVNLSAAGQAGGAGGGAGGNSSTSYTANTAGNGPGAGASQSSTSGGGGAGFGGAGGGANTSNNSTLGAPGATYQFNGNVLGGSGGGGGQVVGGGGGGGGQIGAVGTITFAGTSSILANGAAGGTNNGPISDNLGGGGSGGGIILNAQSIVLPSTTTLAANGGSGGANASGAYTGGGGGGGRILIQEAIYTVGSLSTAGATAAGAAAAVSTFGGNNFPGGAGANGTITVAAGTSVVNSGQTLLISNGQVGNASFTSANYQVAAGGQLTAANSAQSIGTLTGAGNVNLTGSALTVGVGNATSTFAGAVASDSTLTKVGTGTFTVAGPQSYGGDVAVNAGTLNVAAGGSVATTGNFTNAGRVSLADASTTLTGGTFTNQAGATLTGSGTVAASLANAGTVRVANGGDLVFAGSSNANSGTIAVQGGIVEFTRGLLNNAGGSVTGYGTIVTASAGPSGTIGLTNSGTLAFSGGSTDIFGRVQNTASGTILSAGGGVLTLHDGLDFVAGGTIRTESGARTVVFGPTRLKGDFTGGGTVELTGTIDIDPQLITFGGNLTFTNNTVFNMAVEGPGRGTQYDSLAVAGLATLAGLLNFNVGNGFVPTVGQQFLAISYGSRSGVFGSINAFGLAPDEFLLADYRADGLYLTVASNAVPEPSSLALLGAALAGAGTIARRRRAMGR